MINILLCSLMVYIDIQFSYNFALFISIFKLQTRFRNT